jgi:nucleoside-diphosphate-sugar epimerase
VVNVEKIRRELRWTPRYTLDKGLKLTKDWFDTLGC